MHWGEEKSSLIWHYDGKYRASCILAERNAIRIRGSKTHSTPTVVTNRANGKVLSELLITVITNMTHFRRVLFWCCNCNQMLYLIAFIVLPLWPCLCVCALTCYVLCFRVWIQYWVGIHHCATRYTQCRVAVSRLMLLTLLSVLFQLTFSKMLSANRNALVSVQKPPDVVL